MPQGELCRFCGSPLPTHTTCGFEGASVTSPIEAVGWLANTAWKVCPAFVVFQTPPVAVPT